MKIDVTTDNLRGTDLDRRCEHEYCDDWADYRVAVESPAEHYYCTDHAQAFVFWMIRNEHQRARERAFVGG